MLRRGADEFNLAVKLVLDTTLWLDPVRVADSTPVECGRSRETVKRSDLAGFASYGYCASHSRRFWGLRLHLITTVHGLPVSFALTSAKPTNERSCSTCSNMPRPTHRYQDCALRQVKY